MTPYKDESGGTIEPDEVKVLVVDDSALVRQTVSSILRDLAAVTVVGIASNGEEAVKQIQKHSPDLITLDVEMPVMNGIETLREMKRLRLKARAVMLSSLTSTGAQVTLDALYEGAFDFIAKPTGGILCSRETLQAALIEKINAFRIYRESRRVPKPHRGASERPTLQSVIQRRRVTLLADDSTGESRQIGLASEPVSPTWCDVVVIGVSTGGPQSLRHVIPKLEADFPIPVLLIQHMPATYTDTMARRLDETSPLSVREAVHGEVVGPGCVLVAPGGRQMKLVRRSGRVTVQLTDDPLENGCRPAVDYTLRSIAEVYGGKSLAVIMTGMGKDGLEGCRTLKRLGGVVFSQDEESSAVYGMPKAVFEAGLADRVLPLGKIAPAITRHVHRCRIAPSST